MSIWILWCDFCENLDNREKCHDCEKIRNEKPSEFKEKAGVTAYRKAMSEVTE